MKFFLDTASLKDISWASQAGLIDGVTTNPSLLAKQAGDLDPKDVLKEICSLVDGPVSAEVVALDTDAMVREGGELAKIADNIVVKIPMTEAGMVAVRRLASEGIKTNVTLCFSSVQCLIAAKAGATYVSPFIGRLDDVGQEGMDVIREARVIFDNYQIADNIVVKIPMTEAGMVAVRRLASEGIKTNVTLCFSSVQCLIAAKAGATYVSPFIGRLDDVGQEGMDVIREARVIFDNYQIA